MRTFGVIVLLCLAVSSPGHARELTDQERALCRPDAVRYCLLRVGDPEALRQCLRDNRERLSTPCRELLRSRGN